jgi:hypothetical protein
MGVMVRLLFAPHKGGEGEPSYKKRKPNKNTQNPNQGGKRGNYIGIVGSASFLLHHLLFFF